MKTFTVDSVTARQILKNREGRMLTVTALKKDGTTTRQNGKLAPSPASHKASGNLVTIQRSRSGEFRTVDVNRITRIAFDNQVINVK